MGFGDTPAEAFDDLDERDWPAQLRDEAGRIKRERLKREAPVADSPGWLLEPEPRLDANDWFVLYGKNIQDGVAGFGSTIEEAIAAFDHAWFTHTGPLAWTGSRVIEE